jgi:peptidylprolyl isomerase
MPRTPSLLAGAAALVLLASCGDPPPENEAADTAASTPATVPVTSAATPTSAADGSEGTSGPADTGGAETAPPATEMTPSTVLPKPEVSIPDEIPTELVVTDLEEGTGDAAASGDTVVVHYVGVRSEDGTEFDNSYDTGQPFSVNLGAGGVIQGWDEGLVGIKAGGRRQLDIPAELAYGDSGAGEIIQPGDALTFVIDAVAVIPAADASDAPDVSVAPAENVAEVEVEDLVEGDGAEIEIGNTLAVHVLGFRADTGEQILSTWENGQPDLITYEPNGLIPALFDAFAGMKAGGRRMVTLPYEASFGTEGNEQLGLPAEVDLVLVIDLLAAY